MIDKMGLVFCTVGIVTGEEIIEAQGDIYRSRQNPVIRIQTAPWNIKQKYPLHSQMVAQTHPVILDTNNWLIYRKL